jgi:hypothetical protein
MTTRRRVAVLAAASCALAVALGCQSGGPPQQEEELKVSGFGIEGTVTFKPSYRAVKIEADSDECWKLRFYHGDRLVIAHDGFGTQTVQAPAYANVGKSVQTPCPAPPAGTPAGLTSGEQTPRAYLGPEFSMLVLPLQFTDEEPSTIASIAANAADENSAVEMMEEVIATGPGGEVPEAVRVGYLVTVILDANGIHIVSSLPERFASYVITVDGVPYADKSAGFNAASSSPGGSWFQLQSVLPLELALTESVILLEQQGAGQDMPSTIEVTL